MRIVIRIPGSAPAFLNPVPGAPRTAILASGFAGGPGIRIFKRGWNEEALLYAPAVIAATAEQLRDLAYRGVRPSHAVVALTPGIRQLLTETDRETFWEAFGVPIFEQCLGPKQRLIAAECEAHEGLHFFGTEAGLPLETAPCGCGSKRPRLMAPSQAKPLVLAASV